MNDRTVLLSFVFVIFFILMLCGLYRSIKYCYNRFNSDTIVSFIAGMA